MATENYYDALTDARLAVWQAIDNHHDTRELFQKKFRFGPGPALVNQLVPGFGDLDALWIMPKGSTEQKKVSTQIEITHVLYLVMWTRDWNADLAERNVLKLTRAIHSATPVGGPRYTAYYAPDVQLGGVKYEHVTLGETNKVDCMKTTFEVNLKVKFVPNP